MGDQEVTAARYYQYGAAGHLSLDRLPFTGFQTTWSVKPDGKPDYDPDSASTGTMWATGAKTLDERISQGPSSAIDVPGKNLPTVLERAQKQGKKVGNVTTAELTDATPAVLDSHISLRGCQGPADADNLCKQETKAAGATASRRRSRAARMPARRWSSPPPARASRRSTTQPAWRRRSGRTGRCSASSLPST